MPGISPGFRRPSVGRRRRDAFGSFGTPPRSSFGARLRSRVPQYGHSVMYGDTSEPHFLQTTKRSGPLAISPSILRARIGRFDDLLQDFPVVVVGLVHDALSLGP